MIIRRLLIHEITPIIITVIVIPRETRTYTELDLGPILVGPEIDPYWALMRHELVSPSSHIIPNMRHLISRSNS